MKRKSLGRGVHRDRGFGIAKGQCRVQCPLFNWRRVNRLNDGGLLMVAPAPAKSDCRSDGYCASKKKSHLSISHRSFFC